MSLSLLKSSFGYKCFWGIILLGLGHSLGIAQFATQQLPDSVNLVDVRFFKSKEAFKQLQDALLVPEENFVARDQALQVALYTARQGEDQAAEALIETELALGCLRQAKHAEAFDWVKRCLSFDSVLPPLSPMRQRIHLNVGGIYAKMDADRLALDQFKIALQIEELRGPQFTARRYRHCSDIAISFQKSGQMDSAFAYYQRAIDIAQALPETIWAASGRNNLGMAYQGVGRYAEAMQLFQAAEAKLVQDSSANWNFAVSVHDNLGHACIDLVRYADALEEFEGNLARIRTPKDTHSYIKAHLGLAEAFVALGQLAQAHREIAEAERILRGSPPTMVPSYARRVLRLKIKMAEASGDWRLVAATQELLMRDLDSTSRQEQVLKMGALENLLLDKTASFKKAIALSQGRRSLAAAP